MHGFIRSETVRATLSQELRILLQPTTEKVLRRVQVIVPASPRVYCVVDPKEADVGTNKNYNFPVFHPGQVIQFTLAPSQSLAGMADVGRADLALVVENYSLPE